jgi:hypothetical protein
MLFHQLLDCERVDAEVCLQQSIRGIAERNPTSVRGRVQDEQRRQSGNTAISRCNTCPVIVRQQELCPK